jgi:transposase
MPAQTILPDPSQLDVLSLCAENTTITAEVITTAPAAPCPMCGHSSARVHSHYQRLVTDLPWHGIALRLRLQVRRFFCDHTPCPRHIFAERLPGVVAPYARRTDRLEHWFQVVGFALGGEAGARLLTELGLRASPDTVLTSIRAYEHPPRWIPHVLGVDDFAFRRRARYGTILVDLERRAVVDLLPDRTASTLAAWLRAHPGVEQISRDRGGDYAVGARQGAPRAVQGADRFHLLKNLTEVIASVLSRHTGALQRLPLASGTIATAPPRRAREAAQERTRQKMQRRFDTIQALAAKGMSHSGIARVLGLHRHTVTRYLATASCPVRPPKPRRPNLLDPYEPYLRERWQAGYRNGCELWREVVALGYPGTRGNVARWVAYRRQHDASDHPPHLTRGLTPRTAVGLLVRPMTQLSEKERSLRDALRHLHPDLQASSTALESFASLLRERRGAELVHWIEATEACDLPEVQAFATNLRRDLAAVERACTWSWSQGQVEGQVNRLKLLKRQMYGRAKFDLLRARVLYQAGS